TPGQIIVSEATLARLGNRFEYTELPPAHLKGKEKPFKMFEILRTRPVQQVPASLASTSTSTPTSGESVHRRTEGRKSIYFGRASASNKPPSDLPSSCSILGPLSPVRRRR